MNVFPDMAPKETLPQDKLFLKKVILILSDTPLQGARNFRQDLLLG